MADLRDIFQHYGEGVPAPEVPYLGPPRIMPSIVTSTDGQRSIEVLEIQSLTRDERDERVTSGNVRVRLVPDVADEWLPFTADKASLSLADSRSDDLGDDHHAALHAVAELVVAHALDELDGAPASALNAPVHGFNRLFLPQDRVRDLLRRAPASPDEVARYVELKVAAALRFGVDAHFRASDSIRLGVPRGSLRREALWRAGVLWELREDAENSYFYLVPRPSFIASRAFASDAEVSRMLGAPRYNAVRLRWQRAIAGRNASGQQLDAAVNDAVSAAEQLSRIVADSPNATMGEALNDLRAKNLISRDEAKSAAHAFGSLSNLTGIRHGATDSSVSGAEAAYWIDLLASVMRRLLLADRSPAVE